MLLAIHNKEYRLYKIRTENSLKKLTGALTKTNMTKKSWGEGGKVIIRVVTLYYLKCPVIKKYDTWKETGSYGPYRSKKAINRIFLWSGLHMGCTKQIFSISYCNYKKNQGEFMEVKNMITKMNKLLQKLNIKFELKKKELANL